MSEEEICALILVIFFGGMFMSGILFGVVNCIASEIFAKKHKKCYQLIDNYNKELVKCNHYWFDNISPLEKKIDDLEIQKKYATQNGIIKIELEEEEIKQHLEYHREILGAMAKTSKEKCEEIKKEIDEYLSHYKYFKKYVKEMNFIKEL
jgi:hypothetical protein